MVRTGQRTYMKANFERLKPWNPDLIDILPVYPDYEWEIPETEEEAQMNEEIQPQDPAEHESESEDEFEDEPMPEPSDRVLRSLPRVDYREPSEDEFYAVFEIKEEISFGEEHKVTFNVDLDESTDDASRKRKSDSEETVEIINDSVSESANSDSQPAPVSIVEKSQDETLSKGRGEKTGSDNNEESTTNGEDTVESTKALTRVRKNLRVWPNSSSRIVYVEEDFVISKMTKAFCTSADCKFDRELEREIHKGLKNEEFIFHQRQPVGSVAIQPHSLNQEGFDVYYLFVRATALQPVLLEDLKKSTQQLRTELENRRRDKVAVCVPDKGRGHISWPKHYEILDEVFADSAITVYAHLYFDVYRKGSPLTQMNL